MDRNSRIDKGIDISRGRTKPGQHVPVLLGAVLEHLAPAPGQVALDCTIGYGGHAATIARRLGPGGLVIGLDRDADELARTRERFVQAGVANVRFHHSNFDRVGDVLSAEGRRDADMILADLGVSSMQIDSPGRGMHYKSDGPLDLRMDQSSQVTAASVLMNIEQGELSAALRDLGDEPDHDLIATWIVNQRLVAPIETTGQLTRLVLNAKGYSPRGRGKQPWERPGGLHPAARTFQALRIMVNDELGSLRRLLDQLPRLLSSAGRAVIISFHGGEDSLVRDAFASGLASGAYSHTSGKAVRPGAGEVRANPRSASARLRWAVRA